MHTLSVCRTVTWRVMFNEETRWVNCKSFHTVVILLVQFLLMACKINNTEFSVTNMYDKFFIHLLMPVVWSYNETSSCQEFYYSLVRCLYLFYFSLFLFSRPFTAVHAGWTIPSRYLSEWVLDRVSTSKVMLQEVWHSPSPPHIDSYQIKLLYDAASRRLGTGDLPSLPDLTSSDASSLLG